MSVCTLCNTLTKKNLLQDKLSKNSFKKSYIPQTFMKFFSSYQKLERNKNFKEIKLFLGNLLEIKRTNRGFKPQTQTWCLLKFMTDLTSRLHGLHKALNRTRFYTQIGKHQTGESHRYCFTI